MKKQLRLVLGDQLNAQHSWFDQVEPDTCYLLAELRQETDYTKHHIQKICAIFAAMQNFATRLRADGHQVIHLTLDETASFEDLPTLISHELHKRGATSFEFQQPDEYRLRAQLLAYAPAGVETREVDTEHFLVPFSELPNFFSAGKAHRMEAFYRNMRRTHNVLMSEGQPEGGQWNYDADNRQKLKPVDIDALPEPLTFSNDVREILDRLDRHGVTTIGRAAPDLLWPIDRDQALLQLGFFCDHCLPLFGRFQDAMTGNGPHRWSLYHSRISFALNTKMLHPVEVMQTAISTWQSRHDIPLASLEGFIRQILGWREFIRGIYWVNMPGYEQQNALSAERQLPGYFWNGDTSMRCVSQAVNQSLDTAYAHHIQRLMVTGTFCLLAGIDPKQVDAWYLGIYIDAFEWVEMPNTRGMSQFADAGLVASKPYAASGNYINKMSDYCKGCDYNVKEKFGDKACPFNSLYWDFMTRHRSLLEKNPRIGMVYRNWDRQDAETRTQTLQQAQQYLSALESL